MSRHHGLFLESLHAKLAVEPEYEFPMLPKLPGVDHLTGTILEQRVAIEATREFA